MTSRASLYSLTLHRSTGTVVSVTMGFRHSVYTDTDQNKYLRLSAGVQSYAHG